MRRVRDTFEDRRLVGSWDEKGHGGANRGCQRPWGLFFAAFFRTDCVTPDDPRLLLHCQGPFGSEVSYIDPRWAVGFTVFGVWLRWFVFGKYRRINIAAAALLGGVAGALAGIGVTAASWWLLTRNHDSSRPMDPGILPVAMPMLFVLVGTVIGAVWKGVRAAKRSWPDTVGWRTTPDAPKPQP